MHQSSVDCSNLRGTVTHVAVHPQGMRFAVGTDKGEVALTDIGNTPRLHPSVPVGPPIQFLAFSNAGKLFWLREGILNWKDCNGPSDTIGWTMDIRSYPPDPPMEFDIVTWLLNETDLLLALQSGRMLHIPYGGRRPFSSLQVGLVTRMEWINNDGAFVMTDDGAVHQLWLPRADA